MHKIQDVLPEEFVEVLVFKKGAWRRGNWYQHGDGTVCWRIEGTTGHPTYFEPPTHWMPMPGHPGEIDSTERLTIGDYTIAKSGDADIWITRPCGEGMRVSKSKFERVIDEFYNLEF